MAMTLRTDPELDAALTSLSERLGISKQEVVRRAVHELDGKATRARDLAESSGRMRARWGDVLDRLGSV